MNLISRDNLRFEFLIETLDDLWVLSQFIVPFDKVYGKSERKVKIGSETNYKVVKKVIFVELLVNKVKYENEQLRISGEIQNETEFTAIGANHTLNYVLGSKIEVEKNSILRFEEKIINSALTSKKSHNLLVLLDKDELIAIEFSDISYRVLFHEKGLGSKKYSKEDIDEEEQKYRLLVDLLKRDYSKIILAGPGIYKDKLQKYLKDRSGIDVISFSYPDVNTNSVQSAIKKINESSILGESQIAYENEYVSKLLENINKGIRHVYGYQDSEQSINAGACEVFLVTTDFIEKEKDEGGYKKLSDLMLLVEKMNGELVIVNSKNESGRVLDGIGGVACINRY